MEYATNITETEKGRWVTINGTPVLIDDDGVAQSGPLKGKQFGKGGDKGDAKEKADEPADKPLADAEKHAASEKVRSWAHRKFKNPEHAEAFTKWFGDSKVVDANGEPLTVYHGTGGDFSAFRADTKNAWSDTLGVDTFFFSADKATASTYSAQFENGRTMELSLAIKNPLEIDANGGQWHDAIGEAVDKLHTYRTPEEKQFMDTRKAFGDKYAFELDSDPDAIPAIETAELARAARAQDAHILANRDLYAGAKRKPHGYDGIIVRNVMDMTAAEPDADSYSPYTTVYVAFSPSQIKSATGNRGTFDPASDDIRESVALRESTDLDRIRSAGESDLERRLERLDRRHREKLRRAIREYGRVQNIPQQIWDEIEEEIEAELAAIILLLILSADDWTLDAIRSQGGAGGRTARQEASYGLDAARQSIDTATRTIETLRDRLARRVEDARISGPGGVGELTRDGIDEALDDVFSDTRRRTIATDLTTRSLSIGQRGAGGRSTRDSDGQRVRIELRWVTENDDRVCLRCAPLDGTYEDIWGLVFPDGPGPEAHPNCRCSLEPVAIVEGSTADEPAGVA